MPPLIAISKGINPRPRKAPVWRPEEHKLHALVADTLDAHLISGWVWTTFPAGGRRDKIAGARFKRLGLKRGFPDIQLISPSGRYHGLELKRLGEELTEEQEEFRAWAKAHGVPHAVAWSIDQVLATLDAWGCLRIKIASREVGR
jgi:hypothetical protein